MPARAPATLPNVMMMLAIGTLLEVGGGSEGSGGGRGGGGEGGRGGEGGSGGGLDGGKGGIAGGRDGGALA